MYTGNRLRAFEAVARARKVHGDFADRGVLAPGYKADFNLIDIPANINISTYTLLFPYFLLDGFAP